VFAVQPIKERTILSAIADSLKKKRELKENYYGCKRCKNPS
jgi:hypothetical protein